MRVILVNGWAAEDEALQSLAASLTECSPWAWHVEVFSLGTLRARGDALANPRGISSYANGLLAELKREPALLIGWSTGGIVALETALCAPALVLGFVGLNTTGRFCATATSLVGTPLPALKLMQRLLPRDPQKVLAGFFEQCAGGKGTAEARAQFVDAAMEKGLDELLYGLKYLEETDLMDLLGELSLPSLVLHSDFDLVIPAASGKELAKRLLASFYVFSHQPHALPVVNSDAVAKVICRFWERHER